MSVDDPQNDFLTRYQRLVLDEKLQKGSPSERADLLRKTVSHLQYAAVSGLMSKDEVENVSRQYDEAYANIVDSFDEETGLNNYAEGALAICGSNKNDSQNWKSSLTLDRIKQLPCIQKTLKNISKDPGSKLVTKHKLSDLLPQCQKENIHISKQCETVSQNQKDLPSKFNFLKQNHGTNQQTGNQSTNKVLNLYNDQSKGNQSVGQNNIATNNPTYGNVPNNQPFGGSVPNNQPFGGNVLNNQPFGGNVPNNLTSGGNVPNNPTYGSAPNNPTYGSVPNNQPFGGSVPNNQPFGGNVPNNLTSGGNVPNRMGQQQSGRYGSEGPGSSFNENNPGASNNPLFSTGGRNQAFSNYGDGAMNRPANNREPYSGKRPYNQTNENYEEDRPVRAPNVFKTAKQQLDIDNQRKYGGGGSGASNSGSVNTAAYGTGKKSLGTRRGLNSKFVPPVMNKDGEEEIGNQAANTITRAVLKTGGSSGPSGGSRADMEGLDDEKLKGIEPKMIELIMNEIMDNGPPMTWDDVAGLDFAKKTIKEIVVWPMLRPDIFTGLRGPPKGLLLFGPPGTGKTLIGKCIASQSKSTFFCISASSLTSKWVGEGEKMVRALFAVARSRQPAVVFIDEIDSLLTQRTDGENEASRRIKTEFLVQLDGASTSSEDRLLVIGATNRPQEIDEAARRRFVKRLYIPLPESPARRTIITNLLRQQTYELADDQLCVICEKTDGFSGADMATLCREAALGPIRDMSFGDIEHISADQVRPICYRDFEDALHNVKPSVSEKDLDIYIEWNNTFGSGGR